LSLRNCQQKKKKLNLLQPARKLRKRKSLRSKKRNLRKRNPKSRKKRSQRNLRSHPNLVQIRSKRVVIRTRKSPITTLLALLRVKATKTVARYIS